MTSPVCLKWDPEGETSQEEEYGHEWEGCQKKIAAAERINSVHGGKCKEEVDDAESQ